MRTGKRIFYRAPQVAIFEEWGYIYGGYPDNIPINKYVTFRMYHTFPKIFSGINKDLHDVFYDINKNNFYLVVSLQRVMQEFIMEGIHV